MVGGLPGSGVQPGSDFLGDQADGDGALKPSRRFPRTSPAFPMPRGERASHTRAGPLGPNIDLAADASGVHLGGAGHVAFAEGVDHEQWLHRTLQPVTINARPSGRIRPVDEQPSAVNGQPGDTERREDLRAWCGA